MNNSMIWQNGKMIRWSDATTHVMNHSLHYGSAVFEGVRVYRTAQESAIFKLDAHIERFFYSAAQLGMQIPFSKKELREACVDTVQHNNLEEGYIRPLVYYGSGSMKVVPPKDHPVEVIIACWPWGNYLSVDAVDVAISQYIRIHPRSTVADAKICGHYVNSLLAGLTLRDTHYHEALLLDDEGFVAEGSAENIFIVKNNKIITTPFGTILMGITREVVMQIAREFNYVVEERRFKPEEIFAADEAFFTGTAVEVTAIRSLDDQIIADGSVGPITKKIRDYYQDVVHGRVAEYQEALTNVPKLQQVAG